MLLCAAVDGWWGSTTPSSTPSRTIRSMRQHHVPGTNAVRRLKSVRSRREWRLLWNQLCNGGAMIASGRPPNSVGGADNPRPSPRYDTNGKCIHPTACRCGLPNLNLTGCWCRLHLVGNLFLLWRTSVPLGPGTKAQVSFSTVATLPPTSDQHMSGAPLCKAVIAPEMLAL